MEQKELLLDAVALKHIIDTYPSIMERVETLEHLLGIYKANYIEKTVSVGEFCPMIKLERTSFERWRRSGLIRTIQAKKGFIVEVPQSEATRINELCKDVPLKQRFQYLLNLKQQSITTQI